MNPSNKYFTLFCILLLAFGIGIAFQGTRGLYESSEGRYAECAREMVETGNYLEPQMGYRPHWTKPPLTYWAIAVGLDLLGDNEWAVRLYNAIAFVLTVAVVVLIGAELWGNTCGLIAGFVYATSPFPVIGAFFVTTDTLLTLWAAAAILCYLKARNSLSGRVSRFWLWAMWLLFGMACLTKGPAGLIFLIPLLVWHLFHKSSMNIFSPVGILLFLAVGGFWYISLCLHRPEALSFLINEQLTGRLTGTLHGQDAPNPDWYMAPLMYLPALTIGAGLWTGWLFKGFKFHHLLDWLTIARWKQATQAESMLSALMIPIIIFFAAKSKLIFYVLPFYTLIALIIARKIQMELADGRKTGDLVKIAVISGVLLVTAKGVFSYVPSGSDMRPVCAVCQEIKTNLPHYVAFDQPKLFGLQFYLHGKLKRYFSPGRDDEGNSDGTMEDLVALVRQSCDSNDWIIVATPKHAKILEMRMDQAGIHYTAHVTRYWTYCQSDGLASKKL